MADAFAALPADEEGDAQAGGLKQVRLLAAEVDSHMQQWVRQRDN